MMIFSLFRPKLCLVIFLITPLLGCYSGGIYPNVGEGAEENRCPPIEMELSTSDIIGTWNKWGIASNEQDQLMFYEDGTYAQTINLITGDLHESKGNRWWIERSNLGGYWLHLEKMRFCEYDDTICNLEEGGGGTNRYYDYCENKYIYMKGEVILAIIGSQDQNNLFSTYDITLLHMREDLDSTSGFYVYENSP